MIDSITSLGGPRRLRAGLVLLAAVAALLWIAAPAGAVNFPANGGTLGGIPDGTDSDPSTCPDASFRDVTFTVSGLEGTVSDVRTTFTLAPAHTFAGDLRVELFAPSPSPASHVIFSRTGATSPSDFGDNSDVAGPYVFLDTAGATPTWWTAAATADPTTAILSGSYRASTPGGSAGGGQNTAITPSFSGLTNPNGTWTLRFSDCLAAATGTVSAASLDVSVSPPVNDAFASAVTLNGSSVIVNGNNRGATQEAEPIYCTEDICGNNASVTRSVWYRWTAPGSGPASVDLCNTNPMTDPIFDSMLAVFTGSTLGTLTTVASNNNSADCPGGSFRSKVNFTATQGTTYRILVDGCCGAPAGDFRLNLAGPPGPLLPFTPEGSAPTKGKPSNDLTLGKLKLNKDNGTATLKVAVPGEGKLSLAGKGLVKQRPAARGWTLARQVFGAGKFKLTVKAKGAKKAKLNDEGEVKVKAKVTFKPTGGTSATDTKKITLKKD